MVQMNKKSNEQNSKSMFYFFICGSRVPFLPFLFGIVFMLLSKETEVWG